jgi:hypothetical protein
MRVCGQVAGATASERNFKVLKKLLSSRNSLKISNVEKLMCVSANAAMMYKRFYLHAKEDSDSDDDDEEETPAHTPVGVTMPRRMGLSSCQGTASVAGEVPAVRIRWQEALLDDNMPAPSAGEMIAMQDRITRLDAVNARMMAAAAISVPTAGGGVPRPPSLGTCCTEIAEGALLDFIFH